MLDVGTCVHSYRKAGCWQPHTVTNCFATILTAKLFYIVPKTSDFILFLGTSDPDAIVAQPLQEGVQYHTEWRSACVTAALTD